MIGEVPIPLRRIDIRTRLGRSRLSLLLGHVVATAPDEWISREDRHFLSNYSQRLDDYILLREDALASPETLLELQNQQMQDYVRVIAILRSGDYVE